MSIDAPDIKKDERSIKDIGLKKDHPGSGQVEEIYWMANHFHLKSRRWFIIFIVIGVIVVGFMSVAFVFAPSIENGSGFLIGFLLFGLVSVGFRKYWRMSPSRVGISAVGIHLDFEKCVKVAKKYRFNKWSAIDRLWDDRGYLVLERRDGTKLYLVNISNSIRYKLLAKFKSVHKR
jgi:hypothetical protein